jgi:type I restriction enzyme, R subunit
MFKERIFIVHCCFLTTMNQDPEQLARDNIDAALLRSGWTIQDKSKINLAAGSGVAVKEYQIDVGRADYVLFVNKKPVGFVEFKRLIQHNQPNRNL